MGVLVFIFCSLITVVGAVGFRQTLVRLQTLSQRAEDAWTQLTSLLADRHLVLTHLVDAMANSLETTNQVSDLDSCCQRAEACLESIRSSSNQPDDVDRVDDSQRQLGESLQSLLAIIDSSEELKTLETVAGCLRGIEAVTAKIGFARVAYNDAAITYNTYAATAPATWVLRIAGQPHSYCLIDLSSGNRSGSLPASHSN